MCMQSSYSSVIIQKSTLTSAAGKYFEELLYVLVRASTIIDRLFGEFALMSFPLSPSMISLIQSSISSFFTIPFSFTFTLTPTSRTPATKFASVVLCVHFGIA
ncbi:hypothetical protein ACOSP7_006046 [Xanthoceras sorbifolium]